MVSNTVTDYFELSIKNVFLTFGNIVTKQLYKCWLLLKFLFAKFFKSSTVTWGSVRMVEISFKILKSKRYIVFMLRFTIMRENVNKMALDPTQVFDLPCSNEGLIGIEDPKLSEKGFH